MSYLLIFTIKMNHEMRRGRNKQLNGMKMNIKCIQKRRSKSLPFTCSINLHVFNPKTIYSKTNAINN